MLAWWQLAVLVLLVVALRYIAWPRVRYAALFRMPGPRPNLLLGNALQIPAQGPELLEKLREEFVIAKERDFVLWLGPAYPLVNFVEPETCAEVFKSASPKSPEYAELHRWLGQGLLTSAGPYWHSKRRLLTPAFHYEVLKDYVQRFVPHTTVFLSRLGELARTGAETNIFPLITAVTLDIIGDCAFGQQLGAQTGGQTSAYVDAVYLATQHARERIGSFVKTPRSLFYRFSPTGRRVASAIATLHRFSMDVIRARKSSGSSGPHDFLDALLEARHEDNSPLSDDEVREEVDTFMFEGHDTTAAALLWAVFEIARHPDVEARMLAELNAVIGDRDYPTYEQCHHLPYTTNVIKEVLRLHPSVPVFSRSLDRPIVSHGCTVPTGTTVLVSVYFLHRQQSQWGSDALEFRPERFDDNRARHPFAYVPFSAGSRNCIGQKFAQLEETMLLAAVIKRFHIEVTNAGDVREAEDLILRPHGPVNVRVFERRRAAVTA